MTTATIDAVVLADPTDPDFRLTILGGSDAAMAAGVSPWGTAVDLWLEKSAMSARRVAGEAAELGHHLEPVLMRIYAMRTGHVVLCRNWWGQPMAWAPDGTVLELPDEAPLHLLDTLRDPEHPFRACHLDGVAFVPGSWDPARWVEGKTAGRDDAEKWGEDGSDMVPPDYLVQTQHNADVAHRAGNALLPVDVPLLAGGYGGHKVRVFTIPPAPAFMCDLRALELDFWGHVKRGIPPALEYSARGTESLKRLHPTDDGEDVLVAPESPTHQLAIEAAIAKAAYDEAEAARDAAYARLQEAQGKARGLIGDRWKTSWPTVRQKPAVAWEKVARELADALAPRVEIDAEVLLKDPVNRHTSPVKPYRRFLFTPKGLV